jgi:hypothetical protein
MASRYWGLIQSGPDVRGELLPKNKAPLLVSLHNEFEYEGIKE